MSLTVAALASPFTTTVPGTSIIIPTTYPQSGGIVVVLEGTNGNIYYQFANPSTMFIGYQNSGTPAAFNGNPFQIAPVVALNCGISTCSSYLGGGITRVSIRFTAYDGDSQAGMFDFNDLTLRLNGIDVGNWSPVATQNTNLTGTTVISSNTGFGNNTFDTGWFQSTDPALMSNILATGSLISTVYDADPNDNYWDFTRGSDADTSTVPLTVAPGFSINKTASSGTYAAVGDIITYNYLVTNIGSVYIDNLSVSDDKIGAVTCSPTIIYPVAGPTGVTNCSKTYTITQANIDAGLITNNATALGTPQAGSLGSVSDSLTITGPAAASSMVLTKTATPTQFGAVGSSLAYSFSIENTGNVTLTNSTVVDPLLPSLSCTSGPIAPGLTVTQTCTGNSHLITQADVDRGYIINNATSSAKAPSGATISANASVNTAGSAQVSSLGIAKAQTANDDADGSGTLSLNDTLTYVVTATNDGTVSQSSVTVSDSKITPGSITCASLAPSGTCVLSGTYTVTQSDMDAGTIGNTGSVTSTLLPTPETVTIATPLIQNSSVSIAKSLTSTGPVVLGTVLTYDVAVTNNGNISQSNVIVSDSKITPSSLTCISILPAATCVLSGNYTVTQSDVDAGTIANNGSVTSTLLPTPQTVTIATPVAQNSSLSIAKVLTSTGPISVGSTLAYDVTATNDGTVSQSNVVVSDSKITPNSITCASLAPLGTCVLSGTYTVTQSDMNAGTISNTGSVTSTLLPTPETVAIATPLIQTSSLSIAKAMTSAGPITVGSVLTYAVTATNDGTVSQSSVTVSDSKITPGSITCASLAPLGTCVLSGTYTVTQSDMDAGTIGNTGSVTSTLLPTPETVTIATPITQVASLETTKTITGSGSVAGDIVTYQITVRNTGNITLNALNLTDNMTRADGAILTLTTGPSYVSSDLGSPQGMLLPSETATYQATYHLVSADISAGGILNSAAANSMPLPTVSRPIPTPVSDISDNGIDTDGNIVNDPTRLLLDPSGVIYSSATGLPLSGVTVFLDGASGSPLPAACVLPAQQGQITGVTGDYRFDIITGGAAACPVGETEYRISFTPPSGYLNAISTVYPPQPGAVDATTCTVDAVPGGLCQISASVTAPPAGTTFPYYLSFLFATGDPDVVNNHIPIDPAPLLTAGNLTVEKTANVRRAHRGDVVAYTITIRNGTLNAVGPMNVVDTLPASFSYQPNSATLEGAATVPNAAGRTLTFAGITVPPRSQRTIKLAVRIGVNISPGDYVNEAVAENPVTGAALSNIAKAPVSIEFEHVFDCGDVIGKVFDDQNSSGYQDKGETGLEGVRLATVKGTLITTDKNGQFHVPCPELPDAKIGSNFILKLDTRTLPGGYTVTTENPRLVRLTAGKATKLNFGAAPSKTVQIDVDARAFDARGSVSTDLSRDLETLLGRLAGQSVTLHLTYRPEKSEGAIAAKRVAKIEAMVRRKWGAISNQTLTLETRLVVSK